MAKLNKRMPQWMTSLWNHVVCVSQKKITFVFLFKKNIKLNQSINLKCEEMLCNMFFRGTQHYTDFVYKCDQNVFTHAHTIPMQMPPSSL